ncbi:C39 family peptidase [Massilia niastensis]|uniref:C39 family peptidase n=1 Tax=Massilia niastensis TaxID=544911 RepID=UPI0003655217|nr:C39 family peptidase [Massilia niastensis]
MKRGLLLAALCGTLLAPARPVPAIELAVGQRVNVPVTSMKDIKFKRTTRQQYDYSCGSAALATLLTHHYGTPTSEQTVFEQMFTQGDQDKIKRQGFSLLDMQRFLASRGFRGDGFQLPIEKLIAEKLPAIVLVTDRGYNHFVVIKGAEDGRILMGDPSTGNRIVSLDRFREIWRNKLLFVIHSHRSQAAFNAPDDWRTAPRAPLGVGMYQDQLSATLPKFGPGDF